MMNDEEVELLHRAAFGRQVKAFMDSDVGQYVLNRAAAQIAAGQSEFLKAACADMAAMQRIQNKIVVADTVVGWLRDAVGDGITAFNILDYGSDND